MVSTDWGTAGNWSLNAVPDSTTDVIIPDATTTVNDPAISIGAVSNNVTIQANGILNGNANTITVSGNWTNSGTFNHGSGIVVFAGTANATFTPGSSAYNNVEVNKTSSSLDEDNLIVSGTATVSGNFSHTDGCMRNGQIDLAGNYIIGSAATGTSRYGTATIINFNHATNNQTITYTAGGIGTHVRIDKAGGTFSITDTIPLAGWTYITGTVTGLDTYTLTLKDDSSGIFTPGSFVYNNIEVNRTGAWESLTISGTATVSGNFTHTDGELNGGQINLAGNYIVGASAAGVPYGYEYTSTVINFNHATNDQTITYTAGGIGAHVRIDKAGGTFSITSNITVSSWTHIIGTVTGLDTYTLTFKDNTSGSFTPGSLTYGNIEVNRTSSDIGYDDFTISSGTLDINGNLTLTDGELKLNTNNPNINIAGNLSIASVTTFTKGSGTLTFDGAFAATFTDSTAIPQNIGDVIINKTNTTESNNKLTLASDMTCDDLTINGATVQKDILDIAGYDLTVSGAFSNSGTIRLFGGETISAPTNNSGSLIQYYGTSGPYTLKNWTYKNIRFSSSSTTTYNLGADLTIPNNLTIDANNTLDATVTPYNINIAGDWTNNGTFTPRTSTVTLDGTTQSILGSTTFYNLTKNVSSADTLTFGNGTTQIITGTMNFQGAASNLLSLRSDSTPIQWNIDPQGTRTIAYLDVKDSNNINASQILVEGFNITDSDNNDGWLFNVASASPTSPAQLKNDGTTAISNQGYTEENNVKLKASATDEDNPEIITLFFETALNADSFNSPATPTTGTSCISGTEWDSCSNKIWLVASSSGDYTSTPYTGTTNVAGLSDATAYKWQVKACDDNNECSSWAAYNATVPNFTVDTAGPTISLSSPANDASTGDNQPTLIWSASDATSGIAKYQLYVDSVLDTDNISNSATSVAPTNELSCGSHTWYIRAYDNVDNYTDSSTFNLTMACGGGLPPVASNPPTQPEPTSENPTGRFSALINNGDEWTDNKTVTLKLNAGADTVRMAISNTEDFKYASQVPYQEEIEWDLSGGKNEAVPRSYGVNTVYVKFYTQYGVASEVVSDSIIYKTATTETEIENQPKDSAGQDKSVAETEDNKNPEPDKTESNKSVPIIFTQTLKFGSNNNQVTQLQNKLKELNFFPENIKSNGNFGLATEQAVMEYQKSKGIYPCGIVGPRTRKALNNEEFITNKDYQFTKDLKYNDKNEEVRQLQTRLQDQNFFPYNIKSTGWFGPITQKAVNIFQKFYKLIQSGIVDEKMREVLNK